MRPQKSKRKNEKERLTSIAAVDINRVTSAADELVGVNLKELDLVPNVLAVQVAGVVSLDGQISVNYAQNHAPGEHSAVTQVEHLDLA